MGLKSWFNYSTYRPFEIPAIGSIEPPTYEVPPASTWTWYKTTRNRTFYYCSKPSTKRWKR